MAETSNWYVKTDDGSVYGPAKEGKLLDWAREGRIGPMSYLSSDGATWTPAALKKELDMKWIVETELGTLFGPFHHDVVSNLINSRLVPPTARIFRLYDGESETGALTVVRPARTATPAVSARKGGIFAGVDANKLAALEIAARRELSAAKKQGISVNLFGGRR